MTEWRTAAGGRIDRSRPVRFTFDDRELQGVHGDTLASALLANGVHLVGRSFKYHRPRGILAAGTEEPSALVTVRRDGARHTPNLPATQVELYEGLQAASQNRWPSLRWDAGSAGQLLTPFIPAGFYYKTFMWPRRAWRALYEPAIRAAAGLGSPPTVSDPDWYAQRFAHCDVLVVGAGPAGLAAALSAADTGARVVICDEQSEPGGSLLADRDAIIDGRPTHAWLTQTMNRLAGMSNVTVLGRTTAFGYFPHNLLGLNQRVTDHLHEPRSGQPRERLWQVRAHQVVLATGSIERPLIFPGNDRPGVMLADAARTYLNRFGVRVGRRAVVVTTTDSGYQAALELHDAGVEIAMIADVRRTAAGPWPDRARDSGIAVQAGSTVLRTDGHLRVDGIVLGKVDRNGVVKRGARVACDVVLMAGGFTPSVHLFSQSRGRLTWSDAVQAYVPSRSVQAERSAGECRGVGGLDAALADGAAAGAAATRDTGRRVALHQYCVDRSGAARYGAVAPLPQQQGESGSKAFVDWQNDVTVRDITLAIREGFRSVEHIKRYTTIGMATDQGKTSNLNALGVVAGVRGQTVPETGLTTFRMPYTPVTLGSLAGSARGELLEPVRTTPIHDWARTAGAVFEVVGQWKRARMFPRDRETASQAVARECGTTRRACGVFDVSTLGKIEVVGDDAAAFLHRMYVNDFMNISVGRARYGVMLREDGFVYDDGVVARLAPDRFHVTTTTGGAARVLAHMEDYLQTEWSDLKVWLTSTTEQWAAIAVQGPMARRVLEPLVADVDLCVEAMPHMSVASGRICGIPMRLFRVSFTGELGFEVNVPAGHGLEIWEAICDAGKSYGITPYGTEAMHVMRAEKGYIIIGQDTDGTLTPGELGLGWAIGKGKVDFVGKRSLSRPAMQSANRPQLVGLLTADPTVMLEEGAQISESAGRGMRRVAIGHVTSAYSSAAIDRSIALAVVDGGRARLGQQLFVMIGDRPLPVVVTSPVFYDPQAYRVNV